jgi:hypothetical protein
MADYPDAPPMTEAFLSRVLAKCGMGFLPPA